jgi:glycosyltransferase involved in cell wall biosynthesis
MIPGSGVDLELIKPQPLPDGVPVVGLPARLIRDKGVGEFAEAAKLLKGRGVAVRFRLLGDPDPGNPTTVTVQEIRDWVDAGILEWQPHTRDINNALAACHIVALPSYREGFPKALIDAAAAGRAVAASDVAGCRHAIVEGRTGVLFGARDAASLANAIERLLEDPKRLQTMGAAARHHAEQNFDIEEVTKRHLELYASLLAIARPPLSKRPNS